MNVYVGIFSSPDPKRRASHRGVEAETVRALSRAAARHKLLFKDMWVQEPKGAWVLTHTEIPRKFPLRELVHMYSVPDRVQDEDRYWNRMKERIA